MRHCADNYLNSPDKEVLDLLKFKESGSWEKSDMDFLVGLYKRQNDPKVNMERINNNLDLVINRKERKTLSGSSLKKLMRRTESSLNRTEESL